MFVGDDRQKLLETLGILFLDLKGYQLLKGPGRLLTILSENLEIVGQTVTCT